MKFNLVLLAAIMCVGGSVSAQSWPLHSGPNSGEPAFSTDVDSARRDAEVRGAASGAAAEANSAHERARASYVLGTQYTYTPPEPVTPGTTPQEIDALALQFRKIREAREAREAQAKQAGANRGVPDSAPSDHKEKQDLNSSSLK